MKRTNTHIRRFPFAAFRLEGKSFREKQEFERTFYSSLKKSFGSQKNGERNKIKSKLILSLFPNQIRFNRFSIS